MPSIQRLALEPSTCGADRWGVMVRAINGWMRDRNIAAREAIVLLPFAQLLPLARRAFAGSGDWMPRVETVKTLAASLGPATPPQPGQLGFDATADALGAATLLRAQSWGAAWARRDPRGFEQAAETLVVTAHELARAAFALAPHGRDAFWVRGREMLGALSGPGGTERLLARVALEWAHLANAPATDRVFALASPSAWIIVQAGGLDGFSAQLMAQAHAPCLWLDTDAPEDDPFSRIGDGGSFSLALCGGFEEEAQCAAAQVLEHVRQGEVPVALVAQDRLLTRRVRALLEREGLRVLDETGWKLSTTRAAARVMALLRAARAGATTDAVLEWLKSGIGWARVDAADVAALEADCRRHAIAYAAALGQAPLGAGAARAWAFAAGVLDSFLETRAQPLSHWLASLSTALNRCGALGSLLDDDAGRQLVAALRLARIEPAGSAWAIGAGQAMMGFDEFRHWVDGALERSTYLPSPEFDGPAQVVITPLARAMLRPFAAAVFPGADDKRLGAMPASRSLLTDAQARELGMPTSAQRRTAELLAFVQILALPRVTLMRRRVDGAEPLADSALVERLVLALASRGRAPAPWRDPRFDRALVPTPIRMSAPAASALLPSRLSASACEALRACPYRFFALNLLRLREVDELERDVEKRDYGTWLHAVLFEFHRSREEPAARDAEVARLLALAAASPAQQRIDPSDFVPFAASFAALAPRYVDWLQARDAAGSAWKAGEEDVRLKPAQLQGTELHGIIDRIDEVRLRKGTAGGTAIELIDYKTGSASSLGEKVRQPFEDTQLAFYAALMRGSTSAPLKAIYLALDGTRGIEEIEHKGVDASANALVEGLAHDLQRLRDGAGLPALGAGAACEHCAARGVCRRDHWADDPVSRRSEASMQLRSAVGSAQRLAKSSDERKPHSL